MPAGVFNFITGGGSTAGQELIDNAGVDGIVFTGSKDVGMHLIRDNAARAVPRPLIIEMGGKNPAIVMRVGRSRQGQRRRHALGVRRAGPEVLGLLARLRAQGDARRVRPAARREDEEDQDRQPARSRRLPGPGHQRGRGQDVTSAPSRRRRRDGGRDPDRRPAPHRRRASRTATSSSRRSSTGCPPSHPLFSEELFVPITVVARRHRRSTKRSTWPTAPSTA